MNHLPNLRWESPELPEVEAPDLVRAIWRAKKLLAEVVYDITWLEGNPHTLPEIQTVLDGITVGGRRLSDQNQILNTKAAFDLLFQLAPDFEPTKATACALQALAAKGEALEEGVFRTGAVGIAGTDYRPPPAERLDELYAETIRGAKALMHPVERGIALFLAVARHQFFWDGNKRTGRLLMNGALLRAGQDIITIPARRQLDFNTGMLRFYESGDGTEMMAMLAPLQIRSRFS